jgi:hypothetical protein
MHENDAGKELRSLLDNHVLHGVVLVLAGSQLNVEVWDKDVVTDDDMMGRSYWTFCPKEVCLCADGHDS